MGALREEFNTFKKEQGGSQLDFLQQSVTRADEQGGLWTASRLGWAALDSLLGATAAERESSLLWALSPVLGLSGANDDKKFKLPEHEDLPTIALCWWAAWRYKRTEPFKGLSRRNVRWPNDLRHPFFGYLHLDPNPILEQLPFAHQVISHWGKERGMSEEQLRTLLMLSERALGDAFIETMNKAAVPTLWSKPWLKVIRENIMCVPRGVTPHRHEAFETALFKHKKTLREQKNTPSDLEITLDHWLFVQNRDLWDQNKIEKEQNWLIHYVDRALKRGELWPGPDEKRDAKVAQLQTRFPHLAACYRQWSAISKVEKIRRPNARVRV